MHLVEADRKRCHQGQQPHADDGAHHSGATGAVVSVHYGEVTVQSNHRDGAHRHENVGSYGSTN